MVLNASQLNALFSLDLYECNHGLVNIYNEGARLEGGRGGDLLKKMLIDMFKR